MPPYGQNLQTLIQQQCLSEEQAELLDEEQKTKIEELSQDQVNTLVAVRQNVGPVMNSDLI